MGTGVNMGSSMLAEVWTDMCTDNLKSRVCADMCTDGRINTS